MFIKKYRSAWNITIRFYGELHRWLRKELCNDNNSRILYYSIAFIFFNIDSLNSQAPDVPELAHQGIFKPLRLSVVNIGHFLSVTCKYRPLVNIGDLLMKVTC